MRTISDDCENIIGTLFLRILDSIGKIECVNCSEEFVDVLMLGIDKIDDNHRFGNIEIEIK